MNDERFGSLVTDIHMMVIYTIIQQGLDVIIDETHHRKDDRKGMIKYLRDTYPGIRVEAHYIHRDYREALKRNSERRPEQQVPEDVIYNFHEELLASFGGSWCVWDIVTSLSREGFDDILINSL